MKADNLRPKSLQEYLGQDQIKEQLSAAIFSAKHRDKPLAHVLLSGPPGLGKTTLALIIAREMNYKMEDLIGSTVGNPQALAMKIMRVEPKTAFFIDEIHALRKPTQEVLYPVLEDNRVLYKFGNVSVPTPPLPPLTVIGATTDLGKLAQPFIDRFQLQFELQFYDPDVLADIGVITSEKLGLSIPIEVLEVIAVRARGTPRYMNNFLKWIRDFKLYTDSDITDLPFVQNILWKKLRVDGLGLRTLDRQYLRVLEEAPGPLGIDSIASRLRQADVTLENTVEPYLMYSGLIERIRNGRVITEAGREHIHSFRSMRRT